MIEPPTAALSVRYLARRPRHVSTAFSLKTKLTVLGLTDLDCRAESVSSCQTSFGKAFTSYPYGRRKVVVCSVVVGSLRSLHVFGVGGFLVFLPPALVCACHTVPRRTPI